MVGSSSVQAHRASNARGSRIVDDDDSTARRWEYNSKAMAAQQEVMAMQETELQGVMPAKIADAVLVIIS